MKLFCRPESAFTKEMQSVTNYMIKLALSNRPCGFQAGEVAGAVKNGVEHGRRDAAGEGVLLARVIAADEQHAVWCAGARQPDFGAVAERRARPRQREATAAQDGPYRLPGEPAETDDGPQVGDDQTEFGGQPCRARVPLARRRLVLGRGTADGRHHPRAEQALAVSRGHAG